MLDSRAQYCIHYNHYSINFSISTVKFFGNTNLLSKSSLNPIRTASEPKSQSLFTHIVPTHPRQILARRVPRRCGILFDFDHHHIETTSHRSWRQWHDRTKSLFENRWYPGHCQRVNLPPVQNRWTAWKLWKYPQLSPIWGTERLGRFLSKIATLSIAGPVLKTKPTAIQGAFSSQQSAQMGIT